MQLTDRVYLIGSGSEGFQMTGHFDCHVYLIAGKDELAVIDAGAGMAVSQIVENIRHHGFEANQVRHLLLTHAHMDHVGGAAKLRAALGDPRVYIHADCAEFLRKGDEVGTSWNVAKEVWGFPKDFRFEACAVDVELQDGDVVRVGEFFLQTIATPGHSIGHVSFLMEEGGRRILFGGDHVFFGGRIRLQKLWDCDLQTHLESLEKLRNARIDVLLPSHGTFLLNHGQKHIDYALRFVDQLLVPPNYFCIGDPG